MDLDPNIIVQIFLVLVTVALVIVTWVKMSGSNNLLKEDLNVKIRPVISRTIIGKSQRQSATGNIIHEDVFYLEPQKILFHFTNSGTLPAVKIIQTSYVTLKINERFENIISLEDYQLPALGPNEKYSIDLQYDPIHFTHCVSSDDCYFGLKLEYTDPKGNSFLYKMTGHFDKGYLMLDDVMMN